MIKLNGAKQRVMKKFLIALSSMIVLVACNSKPDLVQQEKVAEAQVQCQGKLTPCINQCHHSASNNKEEYECIQTCKSGNKKCVAE